MSEFPVRLKATSLQPKEVEEPPLQTAKSQGKVLSCFSTSSYHCLPTKQSLNPPEAAALPVLLLSSGEKNLEAKRGIHAAQRTKDKQLLHLSNKQGLEEAQKSLMIWALPGARLQ